MDDRTLLELAAKAAGYNGKWNDFWWGMCCGENYWDPLRTSSQAFRLLSEISELLKPGQFAEIVGKDVPTFRRAIVRAAAEIELAKSRVSAPGAVEGGNT